MVEVHLVVETEVVGHQVAVGGHQVEVHLVAVMVHQQVVQGPHSRPAEEVGHREVVMVDLQEVMEVLQGAMVVLQEVVVEVRWDQVPLRQMPRWLRAFARKPVITGQMLLRNIQVGNILVHIN